MDNIYDFLYVKINLPNYVFLLGVPMDLYDLKYNESLIVELGDVQVKMTLLPSKDCPGEHAFGIEAPKSVAINREEVYRKLTQSRKKKEMG